jgi:hypothetical protein
MFSVIGLTLDQVSTGSLPQVRLADALDYRTTRSEFRFAPGAPIQIFSTEGTDTQALVARTKYKDQGQFLLFLYFNDVAVAACKEMNIPIRIVDRIEERELPARRIAVLERPYLVPTKLPSPRASSR